LDELALGTPLQSKSAQSLPCRDFKSGLRGLIWVGQSSCRGPGDGGMSSAGNFGGMMRCIYRNNFSIDITFRSPVDSVRALQIDHSDRTVWPRAGRSTRLKHFGRERFEQPDWCQREFIHIRHSQLRDCRRAGLQFSGRFQVSRQMRYFFERADSD